MPEGRMGNAGCKRLQDTHLIFQTMTGTTFNFPNHDWYLKTTEQKFQAFNFQFILNTLKINYEKNTKILHHY